LLKQKEQKDIKFIDMQDIDMLK